MNLGRGMEGSDNNQTGLAQDSRSAYESYSGNREAELNPQKDPEVPTPPELQDKYRFICDIGRGSQGKVFKAERLADGQVVAIKVLDISSVQNWKDYDLFRRESEVLQSLKMEGIAKFYESMDFLEQDHPRAYIVQEYIEGRSMDKMIRSGYRFTVSSVFETGLELLTLLEKLHTHEPPVIHRDLKPANIMCRRSETRDYDVFLIDFGAVANPNVQGGGSTIAGTCGYMPPEQLMGRPVAASDIYALGATLVYMLCGVDPGEMQMRDFRLIIEPHLEQIPPVVVNVLRQMLEPAADKRLTDYAELKRYFEYFAKDIYHHEPKSPVTAGEIAQRLSEVEYYAQPGNIDIWAALDDNVPRDLPLYIPKLHQTDLFSSTRLKKKNDAVATLVSMSWLALLPFLVFLLALWSENKAFIVLMLVLNCFTIFNFIRMVIKQSTSGTEGIPLFWRDKTEQLLIENILRYGRKGIAIIASVQYVSNDMDLMTLYHFNRQTWLYYDGLPSFRIRYRFNPIDDASPNDLVHEIIIHDEPGEALQAGNPISILYYVDPDDNRRVTSLPYPFPQEKIVSMNELYYESFAGKKAI